MIPEIGHFALILTLFVALAQGSIALAGAARGNATWIGFARPAARAQFFLVAISFVLLMWSFIVKDFSVSYVAVNSNSQLPWFYRMAAVWGGHEGSLLLWLLMQTGWAYAVSLFSRQLPDVMVARVLGVLGLVTAGFLLFVLLTSNPFERLVPAPMEGMDLNPLLQDVGLIFHPPLLYMGYVGFSVVFAFAIAALLAGQLDSTWARWSRPWATAAWLFLTLGIALGSWWAYYELGWGGWWFWDPVENSSFVPWLVGTALIHSLAVTEKRASFKNWTVLLAISTFALSLLGAFLVRSGVLTSVHAFATDPRRGVFLLMLFAVVVGSSLLLFAIRAPKVGLGGRFELFSRESLLLVNNVLLAVAAGAVLLGTLYPLFIDALGMGKISVGPPYFNLVFVPLMVPALLLIAVGPVANWKRAKLRDVLKQLNLPLFVAVVAGAGVPFLYGRWSALVALGIALAAWIATAVVMGIFKRMPVAAVLTYLAIGNPFAITPPPVQSVPMLTQADVQTMVDSLTARLASNPDDPAGWLMLARSHRYFNNYEDAAMAFSKADGVIETDPLPVSYTGILPDLFSEGKGVVAQGKLGPDGLFHAQEVLAKHDENYMPREAQHALDQASKNSNAARPQYP